MILPREGSGCGELRLRGLCLLDASAVVDLCTLPLCEQPTTFPASPTTLRQGKEEPPHSPSRSSPTQTFKPPPQPTLASSATTFADQRLLSTESPYVSATSPPPTTSAPISSTSTTPHLVYTTQPSTQLSFPPSTSASPLPELRSAVSSPSWSTTAPPSTQNWTTESQPRHSDLRLTCTCPRDTLWLGIAAVILAAVSILASVFAVIVWVASTNNIALQIEEISDA